MIQRYVAMERARIDAFESIWSEDINAVFADVARYYDRANVFATLGLLNWLRSRFLAMGMIPAGGAPEVLRDYLAVEIKRWGKVIADTGVRAE